MRPDVTTLVADPLNFNVIHIDEDNVLSLNSAQCLLQKGKRDLGVISNSLQTPDFDYAIFDAVVTLNHLFEWYLRDTTISKNKRLECIVRFNPFDSNPKDPELKKLYLELSSFPKTNIRQQTIRALCNKGKHFKKTIIEKQEKDCSSVAGNMCAGAADACAEYYDRYKYSVKIECIEIDLEVLLGELLTEWVEFNDIV